MRATSLMHEEAMSAPAKVAELLKLGAQQRKAVAAAFKDSEPPVAVTVGRGSSDHVCSFAAWSFARS